MGARVLHVGPLPPPVGGMATVVQQLTSALKAQCDVRTLNTVKTTPIDRGIFQAVGTQLRLIGRLVRVCVLWRPDIVHIHTCSWFSFWRSAVDVAVARSLGRHVVLHVHGGQFQEFLESLPPFKTWLARQVFALCHGVIALSDGWKVVLDHWCDPERVVVVPNGVALQPARQAAPGAVFTIICLAALDPQKGQADLLRAVAELPNRDHYRVALLGPEAVPAEARRLEMLADDLGLEAQVDLPGPVSGETKEAWWNRATCFCLPSHHEALPMSMLEAMARGVPVVTTRVGAIPETVKDGRDALLYEPGDVGALGAHLQTLREYPALAAQIGEAGRERLRSGFTLESSVNQLMAFYRRLL